MLLGAHESVSGGYYKAIERSKEDDCDCVQIFTHSPRMWNVKPLTSKDVEEFKNKVKIENIKPNVSHASYLINIANEDVNKRNKAINQLKIELEIAERLGLFGVVLHPGFNKNENKCEIVANSIKEALKSTNEVKLLLETMSGSGASVGSTFEELKKIIRIVKNKRLSVCFDTCHSYSAGYDLVNNYEKVFEEFDKIIGLKNLACFHLNDSKFELGSNKDRHENIGKGKIGIKFFEKLVNDKRFKKVPGYLETPSDYAGNIKVLRKLIK